MNYRWLLAVAGLAVATIASGAAAGAQGISAAHSGVECPSNAAPVDAARLRVPRRITPCDARRRVAAFAGRVSVSMPRPGREVCSTTVHGRFGYRLCVETGNGMVYALASKHRAPVLCHGSAPIAASRLRRPVARERCNLVGRLVTYRGTGVHVPRSGTTCGIAETTSAEIRLCVTADKLAVYAQYDTLTGAALPRRERVRMAYS